ncbi:FtsK/SpoIIIE domain-containing protein [Dactylosporangium sp. NPDC050588]|uniref:FtsK/SpoIIIE domain-containing protein n=1 Tax=Dactylosporangium sp. NPDC050588 TaxID=3157211 RepID=UPI00340D3328
MTVFDRVSTAAARLAEARATLPPGAIELACHAAVPVAVDPTLLNLLRINFFVDPPHDLPWSVEAALLTSPLFKELGGDLYEIDDDLRRHLLISLRTTYGPDRAVQVALLLERYCDRPGVWGAHPFLEQAQRLTAIGIIDPSTAHRWLEDAAGDSRAETGLSKDWFVAMRGRLDRQPDPALRLGAEMEDAIGLLPSNAAVQRLAELGQLPGADLDAIRNALSFVRSDAAASALALLDRLAGPEPSDADLEDAPVPLTDLLGGFPMWDEHLDGRLVPVPFGVDDAGRPVTLDLERHGPHGRVVAPVGTDRRELLRTVVLALAAAHPPHELELLLVDAGGAQTFTDLKFLPHTVGVISGLLTPVSSGRLANDIGRELDRRLHLPASRPKLVIVIDDSRHFPPRQAGLLGRLVDGTDAGLHVLLTDRIHDVRSYGLPGHLGFEMRLEPNALPGFGTFTARSSEPQQFRGAVTFLPHDPPRRGTVAEWLVGRMAALARPRPWIAAPAPSTQPALLDLLGPGRVVEGRGLTAGSQALWGKAAGIAGSVGRKDGTGYEPLELDLTAGNVAIVGMPYTGRVDILISLVLSLALTNTPDEVQFLLLDHGGGLAPLFALPHVGLAVDDEDDPQARGTALRAALRFIERRRSTRRLFLVMNRWGPPDLPELRTLAAASRDPSHGFHILASAVSWDVGGIESFTTKMETKLGDPSTSRIDAGRAAELHAERLDYGLAPDGEPFVIGLIGEHRADNSDNAAALAADIAIQWITSAAGGQRSLGSGRFALVIGNVRYGDTIAIRGNVAAMSEVLGDPSIGGFAVTSTVDRDPRRIRQAIGEFLSDRTHTDQVVLYLAGHVLRDLDGPDAVAGVGVQWLRTRLNACRARRRLAILDVCTDDEGDGTRLADLLSATGDVTGAWMVGSYPRGGFPSFTRALVSGLRGGSADNDGDGVITAGEAFRHAVAHGVAADAWTPLLRGNGFGDEFVVAAA